jgi:hypothetical protein
MSQHDMVIDNQGFAATRADINNALGALISNSSGATAPATTYAYQWWADTTTGILKQRNSANSGWIDILKMSTGAPVAAAPRATRIDVASAATLDLTANAPDTDDIRLTGTAAVTLVTIAVGRVVRVVAGGASSFENNANIVTNRGATLQLAAGDTLELRATAANVVEVLGFSPSSILGYGQTWQARAGASSGTTYYNTYGKPIQVQVNWKRGVNTLGYVTQTTVVGGVTIDVETQWFGTDDQSMNTPAFIVPVGVSYSVTNSMGGSTFTMMELR